MQDWIPNDRLARSLSGSSAYKEELRVRMRLDAVHQGNLLLISAEHPLRSQGEPVSLANVNGLRGIRALDASLALETACAERLAALVEAAGAQDDIVVVSGYRTAIEQAAIYEQSLKDNGPAYTASYVAIPGRSEHQSGLAVDVGERIEGELDFIAPSFPDHGSCLAFKRMAARYGFIQRYMEGKEEKTKIACEPWHFRYVGTPHATFMERLGICLEEYIDYLKSFSYAEERLRIESEEGIASVYYVRAEDNGWTEVTIPACSRFSISGNNVDGFIVTLYGCHADSRQP